MTDIETFLNINLPSPLQPLVIPECDGPPLYVKRDDQIHPVISGNKWRKLQGVINHFEKRRYSGIVSFGGGYSNHLHALGYVCSQLNIPFSACIRGNYSDNLTPMLQDLLNWQSQLNWLSKVEYRQKAEPDFIQRVYPQLQHHYLIPEGGSSQQALEGMRQLLSEIPDHITHMICPVASGGTMAGLIQATHEARRNITIQGIAVLKGENYLEELVTKLVTQSESLTTVNWQILHDFHFGGYAKTTPELTDFCEQFTSATNIPLEPVYSGKLFFALKHLVNNSTFTKESNICALHTGGLQGKR